MKQGTFSFKYEFENSASGMTSLAGLPTYLEMARAIGLGRLADKHLALRKDSQGWTDSQIILSLIMLNLAGGDCVDDLKTLEADEGFRRIMERCQTLELPRTQRRALKQRWRKERKRTSPSQSAVFRYLNLFHDADWDAELVHGGAWIPKSPGALGAFAKVNAGMLAFAQRNNPQKIATLDMDATLVETHKRDALYCYKNFKAYQPMNAWWAEQEMMVLTEFRSGNVPAGFEQKRILEESLALLPDGVNQIRLRSDTAGYQHDLLRYCENASNERFGRIEFAVGCKVSKSFKQAVASVPENAWCPLHRIVDGKKESTGREWAEVCYVTDGAGTSKNSPIYRYLATRQLLQHSQQQLILPGMESPDNLPFPAMNMEHGRYKIFGVVTNMDWEGGDLLRWSYQRCGKSEHAHSGLKEDLASGKLPSGVFGANAAWWWASILAFNLNALMKGLALGKSWKNKRMKAIRFNLINIPGRVVKRSCQWFIRLGREHPALELILEIRRRITAMKPVPI